MAPGRPGSCLAGRRRGQDLGRLRGRLELEDVGVSVVAVILAGGQGERLSVLSVKRAKPAVPFAGKYRIIDFALSQLRQLGHLPRRRAHPVPAALAARPHRHRQAVGSRPRAGRRAPAAAVPRAASESDWYKGTADAVYQNLPMLADRTIDSCSILSGDHVYSMDYGKMIAFHREKQADVHRRRDGGAASRRRTASARWSPTTTGASSSSTRSRPSREATLISMGIYVFDRETLAQRAASKTRRCAARAARFRQATSSRAWSGWTACSPIRFGGYWQDVGTIQSYWEANMGLLDDPPDFDLYDYDWVIHTRSEERPPAKISAGATVTQQPDLARLPHRRDGRAQRPLAGRVRGRGRGRARLDRHERHHCRAEAWLTARSWTKRW